MSKVTEMIEELRQKHRENPCLSCLLKPVCCVFEFEKELFIDIHTERMCKEREEWAEATDKILQQFDFWEFSEEEKELVRKEESEILEDLFIGR